MSYRLKTLAHCALTLGIGTLATPIGFAAPAMTSDKLIVTSSTSQSRLSPSEQQEKASLKKWLAEQIYCYRKETRLATLQDALDYQPGLVIQNFFGGIDQPRLNIRGSGVQSAPLARGVLLLQDGLPATDADGSFHISTLEMRDARMVSVRRGANNLNPQSNSLGGEWMCSLTRVETSKAAYVMSTAPMVAKGYKRHLVAFLTMGYLMVV